MTDKSKRDDIREQASDWVLLLTSGTATSADFEDFCDWHRESPEHAIAFSRKKHLWVKLASAATVVRDRDRRSAAAGRTLSHSTRRAVFGGSIAAAAAFVAFHPPFNLFPSIPDALADVRTATGERKTIAPVPNVVVELNTRTAINYMRGANGVRSMEVLSGEAAVDVSAGQGDGFVVKALGASIEATDGTYNLRCDGDRGALTCIRGAVTFGYGGNRRIIGANTRIAYSSGKVGVNAVVNSAASVAWRDGRLIFEETPLSEVVSEINRYRDGRIILLNHQLSQRTVKAVIQLNRIDAVFSLLRDRYNAKISRLPGGVVVVT